MAEPFVKQIVQLNRDAGEAHAKYLAAKEEASEAKKSWEAKVLAIQEAIDSYSKDYPLFRDEDDDSGSDGGGWGGGGGGPDLPGNPGPPGGGDVIDVSFETLPPSLPAPSVIADPRPPVPAAFRSEAWRSVPMDTLSDHGLSDKLVERMAESGLKTIGDLADFSNAGKRLTDIDGVGESRADEIESAMEGFWAWWKVNGEKSGGDLVTSRPGTWIDEAPAEKPKRSRKKTA